MASPLSIGECLELVQSGIKLYNKIKHDVPDLVADVAERIESLELYLKRVQSFLQSGNVLVSLRATEREDLENILKKTKSDVAKIVKILEKWEANEGPGGFAIRFAFVAQAIFALGSSPKELEDLGKKLDQRQDDLRDWMNLLLLWGQAYMLNANANSPARTPSPAAGRSNYNIMFIDPHNRGRSVVAEAYALLCREWTIRTGDQWRINYIHSAGVLVKARSNTVNLQQQLGIKMIDGDKPPFDVAMSAFFDGLPFGYKYKNDIRKRIAQRRSRGLTENLFATYDFVFVFNRQNLALLENLRDALAQRHGQPSPRGKGKLVLLGEYGTTGYKEILDAKKDSAGNHSTANWTVTINNIKTSFKNFLKRELKWVQPTPKAKQKA